MLEKFSIGVTYEIDGQLYISNSLKTSYYEIVVDEFQGEHLKLLFVPTTPLKLVSVNLKYNFHFEPDYKIFAGGYQSWSRSEELAITDKLRGYEGLSRLPIVKKYSYFFGDYGFKEYGKKGVFHSWTYGYINDNDVISLFGSLSEVEGFTIFNFDTVKNEIVVEKDLKGFVAEKAFTVFDIVLIDGSYDEVFDTYFSLMGARCRQGRYCGYTSWYNYYSKISEDIMLRDLNAMHEVVGNKAQIFQIDDGWQSAVGDWLEVNTKKFPHGMKYLADEIHKKGYKAGLWLAPFMAQKNSRLVKEHPEWLVYDEETAEPLLSNVGWGGAYNLNIYNPEARKYVEKVLTTVLDDWGYDMVKLDFLYGNCIKPRRNHTRARIMTDTMEFLRDVIGHKLFLACGVPISSAFSLADMTRIGADVDLSYTRPGLLTLNREIVSTYTAMVNTIYRRGLSGRAFLNDPDVMILRESNNKFTVEQREGLAILNWIFGDVLFVSDNMAEYTDRSKELVKKLFATDKPQVLSVVRNGDVVTINYVSLGETKVFTLDLITGVHSIS